MMDFRSRVSKGAKRLKSSLIRELLKYSNVPGIISFGGGVPDPETFPREELAEIARKVIMDEYRFSLQYGTTEGDPLLKEQYIRYIEKYYGIHGLTPDNLLITVGSQQALDLIGRVFLDEESIIAMSAPAYLGAISAFRVASPKVISVPLQEDGMDLDYLEERLRKLSPEELKKFKFVYVVPNFHNPAGVTLSLEKRKRLLEMAGKFDFFIVEDDPYGALRFEGDPIPSIYELGGKERVVLLNTFSKVLCPGLRIGLVIGDEEVIKLLVKAKQGADLCSPSLTQRITARYLEAYDLLEKLKTTLELYREKKDIMMEAFEKYLKDLDVSWVNPQGGLFSWLTFPEDINTLEMLDVGKDKGIIWIPGEAFYIDGSGKNHMRVSFCLPPKEDIVEGARRLRETVLAYKKIRAQVR